MTGQLTRSRVTVLDLRDGRGDIDDAEGPVIALDHAGSAAEHDEIYQRLLGNPLVSGVICLAVDSADPDGPDGSDGTVLIRPAPSLGPVDRAATLWIGDGHGVRWRPSDHFVRGVAAGGKSGLDTLVAALANPIVFDAVVKTVSTLPFSTASVGMDLQLTTLRETELRRVQEEAVTQFTNRDAGRVVAQEPPRDEFRAAVRAVIEIDRAEDVLVPGGPLDAARTRAIEAINTAEQEVTRMDHLLAPFPRQRPGLTAGAAVDDAYTCARDFNAKAIRQLQHIDDTVRAGRGVSEDGPRLGVHGPAPARRRQVREDVRHLVDTWLRKYRSVAALIPDLNAAKIEQEPRSCLRALDEVPRLAPPTGPAPAFDVLLKPRRTLALMVLSSLLAAVGVAPLAVTSCLAVAWFAAGLLLYARTPTSTGEIGFVRALVPTSWSPRLPLSIVLWMTGLLHVLLLFGVVCALWMFGTVVDPLPPPFAAPATLVAVLTFVAIVGSRWRRAVRQWRRALDLAGLRAQILHVDRLVDTAVRTVWRPSARRALFAEGLRQAAVGLTAIQEEVACRADDLFTPDPSGQGRAVPDRDLPDRDVYEEVRDVVVTDLVDLAITALRPCWSGIEAGRAVDPAEYTEASVRLLSGYQEHVERGGLLAAPPFASRDDHDHRETLSAKLWACSRVTDALSRTAEDEMTQLAGNRQLGAVNAMAAGSRLVRFASTAVRGLTTAAAPGPAITWTGESEIAGTLRFVPLMQGVFQ